MSKEAVCLALPCRPGKEIVDPDGTVALVRPFTPDRFHLRVVGKSCSLLNLCFNKLWAMAYNGRAEAGTTHFAMLHDDITPDVGWIETLVDELDRTGADIVSAVVPIKDDRGLTSTGLRNWIGGNIRRLTMAEVHRLPETFTIDDMPAAGIKADPDDALILNTGCWVCRFDRPWVEKFPGFRCIDQLVRGPDGQMEAVTLPEDWLFSEWATRQGLKLAATRKVRLTHHQGEKAYPNDRVWGTCETDPGGE